MILKIETEIFGNFIIEKNLEIFQNPFRIAISHNPSKNNHIISISKSILEYDKFIPKVVFNENGIYKIDFPDLVFIEEQINILRHIESFGAIDQNVSSINWDMCSIEWINEQNENVILPVRKYLKEINYDSIKPKILTINWLRDTVTHRRQLSELVLPFNFLREGTNLFHSLKYQNSFLNFYLMIEGFFGNNQTKNNKIKQEFRKSKILEYAVNSTIKNLESRKDNHYNWFQKKCINYHKAPDIDGLIHILVEQRGKLAHFYRAKVDMKNPFNEKNYESLAFISMSICIYASIKLRLEPFREKEI